MLKKWLEVDATASWAKMLAVIKSPAVSSTSDKGNYHCIIMYMYCKLEITNECAYHSYWQAIYRLAGKFGKSSPICQTKTIQFNSSN